MDCVEAAIVRSSSGFLMHPALYTRVHMRVMCVCVCMYVCAAHERNCVIMKFPLGLLNSARLMNSASGTNDGYESDRIVESVWRYIEI